MDLHPDTLAVIAGRPPRVGGGPFNAPIVPASTYHANGELVYGRDGNPGWLAFEGALGALEGGTAVAFSSGLATTGAVFDELPVGAVVVAQRAPYWGVTEQLRERHERGEIEPRTVDALTPESLADVAEGATLVWAESPTNPMLDVVDIPAVVAVAHAAGAMFAVDNTFATPLLQSPLALGADLVMYSATKHIGGHSDLLLGVAITTDPAWVDRLRRRRYSSGATPGALEAFLALRGLRTLPVRVERAQATAAELAERLIDHPAVAMVRYPGSRVDPFRDLVRRQMSGGGTMVSFETHGDAADADAVCTGVLLIVAATSLGGVETMMERRARYPSERAAGTPDTLIRMSVGLEHVDDLWRDLDQALRAVRSRRPRRDASGPGARGGGR